MFNRRKTWHVLWLLILDLYPTCTQFATPYITICAVAAPTPHSIANLTHLMRPCQIVAGRVGPGQYWNGTAAVSCPAGSFSIGERDAATDPVGAGMCTSCSSLVSFRELNAQAGKVTSLQSSGSGGSAATCTCPSNTYLATQGTSSYACAGCPMGTTSGEPNTTAVGRCNANCLQGYYGTPGQFGYGSCTICPTVSPGNAPSSTPSTLLTPVPVTSCTEASAGSYKNDSSVPAVAYDCDGNKADSGNAQCDLCKIGFFGTGCSQCPPKYPSNPVRTTMPPQTDFESDACGEQVRLSQPWCTVRKSRPHVCNPWWFASTD